MKWAQLRFVPKHNWGLALCRRSNCLKGNNTTAQGNALGWEGLLHGSPERAIQGNVDFMPPFQGRPSVGIFAQGVALGYYLPPFQGVQVPAR